MTLRTQALSVMPSSSARTRAAVARDGGKRTGMTGFWPSAAWLAMSPSVARSVPPVLAVPPVRQRGLTCGEGYVAEGQGDDDGDGQADHALIVAPDRVCTR